MKFGKLLKMTQWSDIENCLLKIYPDTSESLIGFESVYITLNKLSPAETNFRICIEEVFDEDFDEEPYHSVFAKDGTLNKESDDFKFYNKDSDSEFANSEIHYGIGLTEWSEWLGMDIDILTLNRYSNIEIVTHCLWEMTLYGFEQENIKNESNRLQKISNEIKNMTEEERKEKLIPWEKIKEDLETGEY